MCALTGQGGVVDPYAGHRGDRPGIHEDLAAAVGDDAEVVARIAVVVPGASDRFGQRDLRRRDLDAAVVRRGEFRLRSSNG